MQKWNLGTKISITLYACYLCSCFLTAAEAFAHTAQISAVFIAVLRQRQRELENKVAPASTFPSTHSVCFKTLNQQANITFQDIKPWNQFPQHSRCGYGRSLHAGEISPMLPTILQHSHKKSILCIITSKEQINSSLFRRPC